MNQILKQKIINIFFHLPSAIFWNLKFGFQSRKLKVIGVTGTDGKTTTSNMIYKILLDRGEKVGLISTISAKYDGKDIDTGFHVTSPNSKNLQKFLNLMISEGVEIVVLEVTSHALDQFRFWGVNFDIVVFTNITHEHIDYHGSFKNYLSAKLKLIGLLKENGVVILNNDDGSFEEIKGFIQKLKGKEFIKKNLYSYGTSNDNLNNHLIISNEICNSSGLSFEIELFSILDTKTLYRVHIPLLGAYNVYNASAALLATNRKLTRDFDIQNSINSLSIFDILSGRMQVMSKEPLVIVDFAHTPNALKNALDTVQSITKGKILLVFGCAGLRDKIKRRMMGEISAIFADQIFLVPEDPRTESLKLINDEIILGIKNVHGKSFQEGKNLFRFDEPVVSSRIQGIYMALNNANKDDTVIICGKGHEQSLCFGTEEYLYTDQETVLNYLNK